MTSPITSLYVLPLILIWFVLWVRVAAYRAQTGVSVGDAGNPRLLERIRCHGNFIEWTPWVLLVLLIADLISAAGWMIHAGGALLVLGRALHPFGLKADNPKHPLRIAGNSLNLLAILVAGIALAMALVDNPPL